VSDVNAQSIANRKGSGRNPLWPSEGHSRDICLGSLRKHTQNLNITCLRTEIWIRKFLTAAFGNIFAWVTFVLMSHTRNNTSPKYKEKTQSHTWEPTKHALHQYKSRRSPKEHVDRRDTSTHNCYIQTKQKKPFYIWLILISVQVNVI
jgi:hypothetical protein